MSGQTRITVILCTYNRAGSLTKTLESIVAQILPPSVSWEILVVDNNSSDETRQVVEEFQGRYPERVRYLLESHQGVSCARNAGIRNAKGDILAFIDDDETAHTGWLQNLTSNLGNDEWAGAGGRVVPQWICSRPRWLSSESPFVFAPLAAFEADPEREQLDEPPFGANMAFRKEVFDRLGGFRTNLGRCGKRLLSNEDTEFGRRLLAAGRRLRYEPSAVTYHPVEEYRLRKAYYLQWWFNKGRSDVREIGVQPHGMQVFGIPFKVLRGFAAGMVRWAIALDPTQRFICKLQVWVCAGQAFESCCQRLTKQKEPGGESNVGAPAEGRG
jgi:glycosyltransferase involved in cell wall biosynthesis